jgi:hypothetical protein
MMYDICKSAADVATSQGRQQCVVFYIKLAGVGILVLSYGTLLNFRHDGA